MWPKHACILCVVQLKLTAAKVQVYIMLTVTSRASAGREVDIQLEDVHQFLEAMAFWHLPLSL